MTSSTGGFFRRAAAYVVDMMILGLGVGILQWALTAATSGHLQLALFERDQRWLSYGYILLTVSLIPGLLYFVPFDRSARGRTPGKRLVGLRVVGPEGTRVGLGQAMLRTLVKYLPWEIGHLSFMVFSTVQVTNIDAREGAFPFTPETEFLVTHSGTTLALQVVAWVLFIGTVALTIVDGRALHDRLAKTHVVRSPINPVREPLADAGSGSDPATATAPGSAPGSGPC